jgi:xanthine dehydrogenase accessory factor
MNNIYFLIPDNKSGSSLSLATVIETQGSTPRKHGSSVLFGSSGLIAGTIGGGILEGKVQKIAQEIIKKKESGIYHFDLDYDISFRQNAICGGKATILIDASPEVHNAVFEQIKNSLHDKIPGILTTIIYGTEETNKQIIRYWVTSGIKDNLPDEFAELIGRETEKLLSARNPDNFKKFEIAGKGEKNNVLILLEPLFPPFRLIIAGAGHIGRALAHLGKRLDFEVTVIDDREEYANSFNIPDADHFMVKDIGRAIFELKKTTDTYIVIVTRGHDDDANALKPCIGSDAAYIGMIGSKKKIAKMHQNFIQNGWATEKQWSSLHAPVGIDILSQTVEEIAVSIAAQLILVRNSNSKS